MSARRERRLLPAAAAAAVALAMAAAAWADASRSLRAVLEVNVSEEQWEGALRNIDNLLEALGPQKVKIEVVAHGPGLGLLVAARTSAGEKLEALHRRGVVLAACEKTMAREKVSREELLPIATTVDSGVAEVVRKQAEGWAYVKVGH